jgi:hypothetical protein
MAVRNPNSRWDSFSDEEMETFRQVFQGAEEVGLLDAVGAALLAEIQNEIDSR